MRSAVLFALVAPACASPSLTPPRRPTSPALRPLPRSSADSVRRLRGGDDGPVAGLQRAYLGVPVATRSWLSAVLGLAALSQAGLVSEEALAVDAAAFSSRLQLWRPLTAAAFVGGVGPQLLQKLYYGISFGRELERELGTPEFLRASLSVVASLTLVCHVLGWPHSADGLIMAVTLLACLQNPARSVSMYGMAIPYQYLPLAQLAMSYLFTQQVPWVDIAGLFVGYVHYLLNDNLKPDEAVPTLLKEKGRAADAKAARAAGAKGGGGGGKPGDRRRKARIVTVGAGASCGAGG